jgi:class 3 adenylate cyclase/tetratricopeptide (TPR) repeat protein
MPSGCKDRMSETFNYSTSPPSERKYLTILCVDLQHSTDLTAGMEPEDAVSRLEPALQAMRASVRRYGGIVSKELGDGLIALFGAPASDANHAVLACYAGLELIRRIAQLHDPGIQVRVGIHSAYVIVRVISGDYSQSYEAGGPALALVDRLQAAAGPGEIIASEACQKLAEGLIAFEQLGPQSLKGFAYAVPVYKVIGFGGLSRWRARSARSPARFVGRSTELSALERAAERAAAGKGRPVAIIGDAGVGKSRIAHELLERLTKAGWQTVEAECNAIDQSNPYAPLKSLLVLLSPSLATQKFVMAEHPPMRGGELSRLWGLAIEAIFDRPITDAEWHDLAPSLRQRAIVDAFCAVVEQYLCKQPTAVLVEDVHWVDTASEPALESLGSLAARHRLLVLLTSRPHTPPAWLSEPNVECIPLRPLDDNAAGALLHDLLGDAATLDDLKARILHHTGSVPFFMEEVVRDLAETATIIGDWGCFTLNHVSEKLRVPPTVEGVIAERIDRLGETEKLVLRAASAIGPRVAVLLLRAVTGLTDAAFQRALASLDASELLIEAHVAPEAAYAFPHDLVREVAYASMLRPDREQLHRRIFDAIAPAARDKLEDAAETLSYHAARSQAWAEAAFYSHLAARKCMARSALYDSALYFETAIERRAIDLRIEARLTIPAIGKVERWMELATQAVERSTAIADAARQVASLVDRASALNFYSTPREAIPINETAVQRAEALGDPGWLSLAEYGLGQAYLTAGRYRAATQLFGRAGARVSAPDVEIPIGTTRPRLSVLCHMMNSVAHAALGEFDHAAALQCSASDIAARTGRPYDRIAAGYGRGVFYLASGDFDSARGAFDEALSLARQYDVKQFIPVVACQIGNLLLQQDEPAMAQAVVRGAKAEAERLGHMLTVLRASIYLARALAHLAGGDTALRMLRATRDEAERGEFNGVRAEALLCEAIVLTRTGHPADLAASNECSLAAMSIASKFGAQPQVAAARTTLGTNLVRQGHLAAGMSELDAAGNLYRAMKLTKQVERTRALHAKLAADHANVVSC